jgi:hypothetical protein
MGSDRRPYIANHTRVDDCSRSETSGAQDFTSRARHLQRGDAANAHGIGNVARVGVGGMYGGRRMPLYRRLHPR